MKKNEGTQYAYFKHKRRKIYIALEDIKDDDWFWDEKELVTFKILWERGAPLQEIALILDRGEIAVFLLSLDRMLKGKIELRDGWQCW